MKSIDKALVEKGKRHWMRNSVFIEKCLGIQMGEEIDKIILSGPVLLELFSALLEVVYQDGRTDSLMELLQRLETQEGECNEKHRRALDKEIEERPEGIF